VLYEFRKYQNFDVSCYNYGWRQLDPQLGRWHSVDKLAEMYPSESPYSYAGNNPISFIDIAGLTRQMNYTGSFNLTGRGFNSPSAGFDNFSSNIRGGGSSGGGSNGSIINWGGPDDELFAKYLDAKKNDVFKGTFTQYAMMVSTPSLLGNSWNNNTYKVTTVEGFAGSGDEMVYKGSATKYELSNNSQNFFQKLNGSYYYGEEGFNRLINDLSPIPTYLTSMDYYNIDLGYNVAAGPGTGASVALNFLTRGNQKGLYLTKSTSTNYGFGINSGVSVNGGYIFTDSSNLCWTSLNGISDNIFLGAITIAGSGGIGEKGASINANYSLFGPSAGVIYSETRTTVVAGFNFRQGFFIPHTAKKVRY
jgi:RHS repeat-associated protein